MTTTLLSHPASRDHITPSGHPERVARIEAVEAALADARFDALARETAPAAEEADLLRCHPPRYLAWLRDRIPAAGTQALDPDTHVSPGSLAAALHAAGAGCRAVDAVLEAASGNAFCVARPPGHHAEAERPMGFCLLGNPAIATRRALEHHGLARVAVVDFDVHHGNGTQALLWNEARVRFVSSHQMPLWPGSGGPDERGAHDQIRNLPLAPGSDGTAFRAAWEPALEWLDAYRPELVLVSAGFDGHRADPLAGLALAEEDFVWITRALCDLADSHADGRLVSLLEGGYDLDALVACTTAHLEVLMERGR